MNLSINQTWIRGLSPLGLATAYVLLVVLSGSIWLTRGTLVGSVAGGLFFGLMMSPKSFIEYQRTLVEMILQPLLFMAAIGFSFWKEQVLMPDTWEPAFYQDGVGVIACIGGLVIAFSVKFARKSEVEQETENQVVEAEIESEEEEPQSKYLGLAKALSYTAIFIAFVLMLSAVRPDWIGSSSQAIAHYVLEITGSADKKNLARVLAANTEVKVVSVSKVGDGLEAKLVATVPVVPFEINEEEINSRAAERKYWALAREERQSVGVEGHLFLERSGIAGWKVVQSSLLIDPVQLSRATQSGSMSTKDENVSGAFVGLAKSFVSMFRVVAVMSALFCLVIVLVFVRLTPVLISGGIAFVIGVGALFPVLFLTL